MTDLATEMKRVGRLSRRLVTPEPREIRYRVIRPFRRELAGVVGATRQVQASRFLGHGWRTAEAARASSPPCS